MPRKTDHQKARAELSKLTPEALQAITARLPASLLMELPVHLQDATLPIVGFIPPG